MRMRVALRMACGLLLLALLFRPGAARAFAGEEVMQAAGFPALVKFIPGDPQRPLVVFIPGAHHTARIAYGGHQGSRAEDFLAYWLVKEGYNFLGISYPIETARPVMQGVYPTYSAQDWGRQAAGIAKREIDAHHLGNRIIVIGWSMGGRIAEPISAAARADGLDLDFFVSFSATPGMTGLVSMTLNIAEAPDGYADRFNLNAGFLKQLSVENAMNGHTIIDQESYLNDYVGKMPVNLEGYGLHYRDGHFVRDHWADAQDFRVYDFGSLPYVAMLMPNEPLDSRHALTDRANWGLLLANKIAADIDQAKIDVTKLPREKWFALMDLVRSAPDRLSVEMNGDHFFFVGEIGAHETARAIRTMEERMHGFKEQLAALLGTAAH